MSKECQSNDQKTSNTIILSHDINPKVIVTNPPFDLEYLTDFHYCPSATYSSISENRFAWWFSSPFGTTVPRLKLVVYDGSNQHRKLLVDDSLVKVCLWEQSIDGGKTWTKWTDADKMNEETYLRITPFFFIEEKFIRPVIRIF
jgi:hypothetical protein